MKSHQVRSGAALAAVALALAALALVRSGAGATPRRADAAREDGRVARDGPMGEREAERRLDGWLRSVAGDRSGLRDAGPRTARRQRDGTYQWTGRDFRAVIHEDGSIRFYDRRLAGTDGISASGWFDVTDLVMRAAGQDPLAVERDAFAEDNAELIERLDRAWRAARMAEALRTLRGEMLAVWQDARRSRAERHRLMFERWDEVDETLAEAREARAVIETVIREVCPAGSEDAFTPGEIERLNAARRHATERFDPYGAQPPS